MPITVSECARRLGANPRDITDLFYKRVLRDDLCPVLSGRRLIPEDYVEMVRMALVRANRTVARADRPQFPPQVQGVAHV